MCIPAIRILFMRKIFFIPAQEIKGGGKNVERNIAFGCKKNLLSIIEKTFDLYRMDAGFEKKGCGAFGGVGGGEDGEDIGDGRVGIVDARTGGSGKNGRVGGHFDPVRFVEQFVAEKIDDIAQPGGNMGTE